MRKEKLTSDAAFDGFLDGPLKDHAVPPHLDNPPQLALDLVGRAPVGRRRRVGDYRREGVQELVLVPGL